MKGKTLLLFSVLVISSVIAFSCGEKPAAILTTVTPATTATSAKSAVNPIELTLVINQIVRDGDPMTEDAKYFIQEANMLANGKMTIKLWGGVDVAGSFQQMDALHRGIFDINLIPANYWAEHLPEADASMLADYEMWKSKSTGLYDFLVDKFNSIGIRYLGDLGAKAVGNYLWTNIQVSKPEDLKGQTMRAVPMFVPYMKALGINPLTIAVSEINMAFERKMIDGAGIPIGGIHDGGYGKYIKYGIDHRLPGGGLLLLANADAFNELPTEMKYVLTCASDAAETKSYEIYATAQARDRELLLKDGVQFIKFSEADGERYVQLFKDAWWEELKKTLSASSYDAIKKLTSESSLLAR